ncbi:MAG TPA: glycosyltransferase family 39 protein [Gammaproteobacteria bacterium]|nr:glycosyltransferase family 39 protein [Gammaproteobacteria bacterium]
MPDNRVHWPLLLAATAALAAVQLWLRPLLPVDETRYLSVAWEMWTRGDFLVPYLNGEPYSHKPPLLFWLIHALWSLFGVSELAARLLPLALSLSALWLSTRLARRLWPRQGPEVAALVPWLLLGGLFWHNFFTLVQFDQLLVLAALLAWLGLLEARESAWRGWLQVGVALGLGVLAKGPVIFLPVLPAALLAPWWMLSPPAGWWRWYAGLGGALLLGALIALAWAIPAGQAGGELYRQAIFWGQSAGRVVNAFAHRSPWWTYLWLLPLLWLPWLLWPGLWQALRRLPVRQDEGVRFCLAVLLPALLLFSLVSGKQGKYLLPLFPVIAVLLARALTTWRPQAALRPTFAAILLALAGALLLSLPWWPQGPDWLSQVQLMWGPALLLWAFVLLRLRLSLPATVRAAALTMLFMSGIVYLAVLSLAREPFDLRPVSHTLAGLQEQGRPLAWLGKYHGQFNFVGRLSGPVAALPDRPALHAWLRANPGGWLLVNYKTVQPDVPDTLPVYPYRGGSLVLWPAARLLADSARLDALPGSG